MGNLKYKLVYNFLDLTYTFKTQADLYEFLQDELEESQIRVLIDNDFFDRSWISLSLFIIEDDR
jgi:hypothetical protein